MSVVSSGGIISSRRVIVQDMQFALASMPSSQSRYIRKLARHLHAITDIGYYAALDTIAAIGLHTPPNKINTKSS